MKKKTKIIVGILTAAVIAAAGIAWHVMNQKNQKTGNSSAEVAAWDVDIEEEESSEENESTTNAKTGDESKAGIWIAILLFSMIVLSCGVKHKKDM